MQIYYNDIDPFIVEWLNRRVAGGDLEGHVDGRSIEEVNESDLREYDRIHLFAGIAGWEEALRLAGWGTEPVWTVSCPCPPFSVAGKKTECPVCESPDLVWHPGRTGFAVCADCGEEWLADSRHLWPEVWRLAALLRPATVLGEQVAESAGAPWFASVRASMEILGYAVGSMVLTGSCVGAPHPRERRFFVCRLGDTLRPGLERHFRHEHVGCEPGRLISEPGGQAAEPCFWSDCEFIEFRGKKKRPVEPGTEPVAYGFPGFDGQLRAYGNAIIPQAAAEFIKIVKETT